MHDTGRRTPRVAPVLTAPALTALTVVAALAVGCSGGDSSTDPSPTGSTSTATSPSAGSSTTNTIVVPTGVELTPEGSQLKVGQPATVAYEPRQGEVGVLQITVTRLERTTFQQSFVGWNLDAQARSAAPYFVRATITNAGESDLGGRPVPLYIVDGHNTLVEPTSFSSAFTPCQPGSFPKAFGHGAKVSVCLVYLSPNKGALTAVSFRPTQDDQPITWTGSLQQPVTPSKHHGKKHHSAGRAGSR